MAGEINFGILDPRLGASFATGYNEAEDRRNELAARVQQRSLGEQQLQQAMSQNELSKYTLSTAKRSDAQREALDAYVNDPKFNPNDPAQLQGLMRFGEAGRGMLKSVMDQQQVQGTIAKTKGEVNAQNLKAAKDRHDALAGGLAPLAAMVQAGKPITHNDVFRSAQQLLGSNVISRNDLASIPMRSEDLPNYIMGLVASNENSRKALEMYLPKAMVAGGAVINTNPMAPGGIGNRLADVTMTPYETARVPQLQQAADASTQQARTSAGQLLVSQGQANTSAGQLKVAQDRLAQEKIGATAVPIQDPNDSSQMILVNPREYKDGGLGAPGVIGLTGKTPAATVKQEAINKGVAQVASVIDDLRANYNTLNAARAIPSTERGALSNITSSAQSSSLGQFLGRVGGTEEQSARDVINSSRLMLLNGIKQATGLSATQLNSNMELTTWLKAVSDPSQSIETVDKILGNIEKFIATGGKYSAKKDDKAAGNTPEQNTAGVSVTLPDGRVKIFPSAEAANQFKKAAGIK